MPILIDYNQAVISAASIVCREKDASEKMIRHMVLDSIVNNRTRYKAKYGEIIVCCDSLSYWRRDVFPYYKAKRKENRKASYIDWDMTFSVLDSLREELDTTFPYKTLRVEKAEADDIIATLCKYFQTNELVQEGLVKKRQEIMIISTDQDFMQLQHYGNVSQYSFMKRALLRHPDPLQYLKEHTIKGDSGDGIPNILSDDDVLVDPDKRQKPITKKKLAEWVEYGHANDIPNSTDIMKRNWDRNNRLVNLLEGVPEDVESNIIEAYKNANVAPRGKLLNYFSKHRLKMLSEKMNDF